MGDYHQFHFEAILSIVDPCRKNEASRMIDEEKIVWPPAKCDDAEVGLSTAAGEKKKVFHYEDV